jgi:hypothetical protein
VKHDFSNQIHKVKLYESPHQVNIKVYPPENYYKLNVYQYPLKDNVFRRGIDDLCI